MAGRLRRVPRTALLASATFAALLTVWSFVNPVFAPPDEVTHSDVVFHLATGAGYPEYDERNISKAVSAFGLTQSLILVDSGSDAPDSNRRTLDTADRVDFEGTFDEFGGDEEIEGAPNQITQHPPLYYWASATGLRAVRYVNGGQLSMDHEVHVLRFMNVLLLAPLPLLAWATARRLGASGPVQIAASLVPLAIPQLTHVGASVNNDNLFLALCGALAVPLASVSRGDRRTRTALVVGTLAGLALLTKGFGVVVPVWIACCYVAPVIRDRGLLPAAMRAGGVAIGATVAVGSWFYVRNLLVHGTPSPSLHSASTAPDSFAADAGAWLGHFPGFLTKGFWGYFGYYEIQLGLPATIIGTGLVVAATASAFLGIPRRDDRPTGTRRLELAALLTILPLLAVFVAVVAWDLYTKTAYLRNFVQGRYLFGAVVPLAVASAVGAVRLIGRRAPVAVAAIACLMQVQGLRLVLDRWWGAQGDSLAASYRVVAKWNPWSAPLVHLTAAATLVLVVALAIDVVRRSSRPPSPGPV